VRTLPVTRPSLTARAAVRFKERSHVPRRIGALATKLHTKPRETGLPLPEDVRARRPFFLSGGSLKALARRGASVVALLVLDLSGLALGLYAALALREIVNGSRPILWGLIWRDAETKWLPFLALVLVLVFWQKGLYAERERRAGIGQIVSGLVVVAVLALAFGIGTGYHFSTFAIFPTGLVLTTVLIGILRASYDLVTRDIFRFTGLRRRAVLVGTGDNVSRLHRTLGEARGGVQYRFLGALAPSEEGIDVPLLGSVDELRHVLETYDIDELIVTDSDLDSDQLATLSDEAYRNGVKVRIAAKTTDVLTQRVEFVPGQGVPLFELRPPTFAGTDWIVKRVFDIAVSALVLVLGLPVWIAIAAAVKASSPGPVFYRDRRIGLGEREFDMLKFRTMVAGAAEQQRELERANEVGGALFKIRDDPRVTRVGRLLRRFSLDEIPQVLNVLRGEMSLVGPRPLPLRDYRLLEDWHRRRYRVLPGMTGLWQISGRSSLTFDDLVRLDFYYLENWSVWLDITILAKTVPAVASRKGAY
jgi:exopolysaccharide biosynthesis polyprenyl glycosylphosphotransferase